MPPKKTAELKPWDLVYVYLIGIYIKSIRQHQTGGAITWTNDILTCTTMIDPTTSWFENFEIPTFDLDKVTAGNDYYIDKSSARVSHLFNNNWLCRYPRPRKFMFENGSDFKQDFNSLLKESNIKPLLKSVKNPQANAPVERVNQVILNMLATKDLDNQVFEHIDQWGEILVSIAWAIRPLITVP